MSILPRLRRLEEEITHEIFLTRISAPEKGSAAHAELTQKVDHWIATLSTMDRALVSKQSHNQYIHNVSAPKGRQPGAYSARQSLKDRQANVQKERDAVLGLALRAARLLLAEDSPEVRALKGAAHALDNLQNYHNIIARLQELATQDTGAEGFSLGGHEAYFQTQLATIQQQITAPRAVEASVSQPTAPPSVPPGTLFSHAPVVDLFTLTLALFTLYKAMKTRNTKVA